MAKVRHAGGVKLNGNTGTALKRKAEAMRAQREKNNSANGSMMSMQTREEGNSQLGLPELDYTLNQSTGQIKVNVGNDQLFSSRKMISQSKLINLNNLNNS